MKNLIFLSLLAGQLIGCASASISKNLNVVSFEDTNRESFRPVGNIEGKDCTWYGLGYGIGEDPTVRSAFANAANQKEGSLIPGMEAKTKGAALRGIKNASVQETGFNIWVTSRRCVQVTGVGLQ